MPNVKPTLATQLRGSAAGIRLGNQLFTGNSASLNAVQVTQTIRAILASFGYNLDKNVVIPLDAAQVIMAGGAFVNSLETANDISAVAMPAAAALKGITTLGRDLGIIDEKSSEILNFGADIAMVVAAGGYNILADIQLVLDVIADIGNFGNQVKADGYRNFNDYMSRIMTPQRVAAANTITKYQKGDINIFEAMGEIADSSPNIFLNYFPSMRGFIPTYLQTISVHTEETSWWGDHRSYDVSQQIEGIYNGHDVVEQAILEKFILDPLQPFIQAEVFGKGKISMHAITILYLAVNQTSKITKTITQGWSALPLMRKFRVTPYILGDEFLFAGSQSGSEFSQNPVPYDNKFITVPKDPGNTGGFTINGQQIFTPTQTQDSAVRKIDIDLENQMLKLDRNGDIEGLLKIPLAKQMLLDYCVPQINSVNNNARAKIMLDSGMTASPSLVNGNSLNIQDYWQGVNLLDILKKTPYFEAGGIDLDSFNYIGDLEDIQNKMKYFQNFWLAKALNMLAYNNIARYLGTNADNIKLRQYTDAGLGVFKVGK